MPDSGFAATSLLAGSPTSRIGLVFCSFSRLALALDLLGSFAFCLCGSLHLRNHWMQSDDGRISVAAANALLDRGFGRPAQLIDPTLPLLSVGRQNADAGSAQAPAIGLQTGENPAAVRSGSTAEPYHIRPAGGVFRRGSALSQGRGRGETHPAGCNP